MDEKKITRLPHPPKQEGAEAQPSPASELALFVRELDTFADHVALQRLALVGALHELDHEQADAYMGPVLAGAWELTQQVQGLLEKANAIGIRVAQDECEGREGA